MTTKISLSKSTYIMNIITYYCHNLSGEIRIISQVYVTYSKAQFKKKWRGDKKQNENNFKTIIQLLKKA